MRWKYLEQDVLFPKDLNKFGYNIEFAELVNRPFPSSPQPPFQSEAKCEVFVMKISFHSH